MAEISKNLSRQRILDGPFRTNPTLHAAVTVWQQGGCTFEEAMIYAVIHLTDQNEALEVRLNKIAKEPASNREGIQKLVFEWLFGRY